MKTVALVTALLIFLTIPAPAIAGQQSIITDLVRSTFKIQQENTIGTVFILGEPVPDSPGKFKYIMITAAHVLENMLSDQATLHLRKRAGNGFVRYPFKIQIRAEGNTLWKRLHGVDIAVMRVALPPDIDIHLISTGMLATDEILERFEVHPGDQVFILGYPLGGEANETGFPILRSGRIASFPLTPTKETKTFLVDFEIFKGNSGGPVLFYSENRFYAGSTHIGSVQFIIGIISGEHLVIEHFESLSESVDRKHKLWLAIAVHAGYVKSLLKTLPPLD